MVIYGFLVTYLMINENSTKMNRSNKIHKTNNFNVEKNFKNKTCDVDKPNQQVILMMSPGSSGSYLS